MKWIAYLILLSAALSIFGVPFPVSYFRNNQVTLDPIPAPAGHYAFETVGTDSSGNGRTVTISTTQGISESVAVDNGGVGYSDGCNIGTSGGSGTGLTVDIVTDMTSIISATMNAPGSGYTQGDVLTVSDGVGGTVAVDIVEGGYAMIIRTNSANNTTSPDNGFVATSYTLPSVSGTNSVTFGVWVTRAEIDTAGSAFEIFNTTQQFARMQFDPGSMDFEWTIGNNVAFTDLVSRSIDTVYCCVFGYNSVSNTAWYSVNGAPKVYDISPLVQLNISGTYTLSVLQNNDLSQRWSGAVDAFTIWTTMLTDGEIYSYYNFGSCPAFYGGAWHQ